MNKYTIVIMGDIKKIVPEINKLIDEKKRKLKKAAGFVVSRVYG